MEKLTYQQFFDSQPLKKLALYLILNEDKREERTTKKIAEKWGVKHNYISILTRQLKELNLIEEEGRIRNYKFLRFNEKEVPNLVRKYTLLLLGEQNIKFLKEKYKEEIEGHNSLSNFTYIEGFQPIFFNNYFEDLNNFRIKLNEWVLKESELKEFAYLLIFELLKEKKVQKYLERTLKARIKEDIIKRDFVLYLDPFNLLSFRLNSLEFRLSLRYLRRISKLSEEETIQRVLKITERKYKSLEEFERVIQEEFQIPKEHLNQLEGVMLKTERLNPKEKRIVHLFVLFQLTKEKITDMEKSDPTLNFDWILRKEKEG